MEVPWGWWDIAGDKARLHFDAPFWIEAIKQPTVADIDRNEVNLHNSLNFAPYDIFILTSYMKSKHVKEMLLDREEGRGA